MTAGTIGHPGAPRATAWDVAVLSRLVLAACVLQLPHILGLVIAGIPIAVMKGYASQLTAMLVTIGTFGATVVAAYRLRAHRPWARWWLALLALLVVVLSPPLLDQVVDRFGELFAGGIRTWLAAQGLAANVVPVVTLVVLARPREDFPSIEARERALVVGPILFLLAFGRIQAWWEGRPYPPPPERRAERIPSATTDQEQGPAMAEGAVAFRPTFRGRPLAGLAADRVTFALERYDVERVNGGPEGTADAYVPRGPLDRPWTLRDGRIEVADIPAGRYGVRVIVRGAAPAAAGLPPGDLVGSTSYTHHAALGGATTDVPMFEAIRVLEPQLPVEGMARVAAPVRLAWHPVAAAARYELQLLAEFVADASETNELTVAVTEPRWAGDIHPGQWALSLSAVTEDGETIAALFGEPSFVVGSPSR